MTVDERPRIQFHKFWLAGFGKKANIPKDGAIQQPCVAHLHCSSVDVLKIVSKKAFSVGFQLHGRFAASPKPIQSTSAFLRSLGYPQKPKEPEKRNDASPRNSGGLRISKKSGKAEEAPQLFFQIEGWTHAFLVWNVCQSTTQTGVSLGTFICSLPMFVRFHPFFSFLPLIFLTPQQFDVPKACARTSAGPAGTFDSFGQPAPSATSCAHVIYHSSIESICSSVPAVYHV